MWILCKIYIYIYWIKSSLRWQQQVINSLWVGSALINIIIRGIKTDGWSVKVQSNYQYWYHFHSGAPDPVLSTTMETTWENLVVDWRDNGDWETTNDRLQRDGWSSRTTSVFSPNDALRSWSFTCSGDWVSRDDGPSWRYARSRLGEKQTRRNNSVLSQLNTIFDLRTSTSWQET